MKVKNSTVVKRTTTTHKDPMRSDLRGNAPKTVWWPGSARTRWGSSQYPQTLAAFMRGRAMGKGGQAGRIKGEMGGWERTEGGEGGKGMNERREELCPTRN